MSAAPSAVPLVGRAPGEILFLTADGPVSAARFVGMAQATAVRLPPGTHVVNLCRDRCRFAVVFAAALLRGQVSLLCADSSAAHLQRLAERFPDAFAVSDEPGCGAPLRRVDCPDVRDAPAAGVVPVLPADQAAALVFTSGSTGEPVAHGKRWGQLAARSVAGGAQFGFRDATVVATVPPQHMYGFEVSVLLPLHALTATWCGDSFFPADIAAALAAVPAPRVLVTAPLHIRALLEAGVPVPPGTMVISATAPLPAELAAAAEARWDAPVHEIFGATEVGSVASRRTLEGDAWRTYPGVTVTETHVTAPWAEDTELSDTVALLPGGFRLLGRRSDLVKVGGRRASLAGLTAALLRVPGVRDAAMLPPRAGEDRMAALAVAPGCRPEQLLAILRREIDPVFLPRPLLLVEALPRNAMGKLSRTEAERLRDLACVP